jgi:hypothetical protein
VSAFRVRIFFSDERSASAANPLILLRYILTVHFVLTPPNSQSPQPSVLVFR